MIPEPRTAPVLGTVGPLDVFAYEGKRILSIKCAIFEKGSVNIRGQPRCCVYLSKVGSFEEGEISKYYLFLFFFVLKDVFQGLPS